MKRVVIGVVLVVGFVLLWASTAFQWPAVQWMTVALYAALFLAIIYRLVRRSRRASRPISTTPTASDAYSDIYLGRKPPTFPDHDPSGSSQIGDPPDGIGPLPPAR